MTHVSILSQMSHNKKTFYKFKSLKFKELVKLRTRWVPIRTISLLPVKIKITMNENIPLYQKLAPKIRELKALGMSNKDIETTLKISRKTIRKSLI